MSRRSGRGREGCPIPNRNYRRSADRERALKLQGEREGWFATRTPGSKGIADVVWIKPDLSCSHPDHFEVKLFQIKVSEHFKEPIELVKVADTPAGWPATVIWRCYPVRVAGKKRREGQRR